MTGSPARNGRPRHEANRMTAMRTAIWGDSDARKPPLCRWFSRPQVRVQKGGECAGADLLVVRTIQHARAPGLIPVSGASALARRIATSIVGLQSPAAKPASKPGLFGFFWLVCLCLLCSWVCLWPVFSRDQVQTTGETFRSLHGETARSHQSFVSDHAGIHSSVGWSVG